MLDSELRAAGFTVPVQSVSPTPLVSVAESAPETAPALAPAASVVPESTVVSVASVTIPPAAELAATIGEGRTTLRDGIVAERRGDEITVQFEGILRATLPQIFGATVDSALVASPAGTLVPPHGLTTDLPTQGLYVPLPGGATLRIWPGTRPGADGPLVVRYRVLVVS
jgi:hypothetical protein